MVFLVLAITAAAFLSMVLPNVAWKAEPMRLESRYLPQLILGFIGLLILFNLYIYEQRRKLDRVREQLTIRLVSPDGDEAGIATDPQTKLFSREFAAELLSKEAMRAKRAGTQLTMVAVVIGDMPFITRQHGTVAADHLVLVTANILKTVFRGADTICRYGSEEFLIVLPDTSAEQAQHAIARLERAMSAWNDVTDFAYKLKLQIGLACHTSGEPGETVQAALRKSHQRLQVFSSKRVSEW